MYSFWLGFLLASWVRYSYSQCYNPDGSEITTGTFQPCVPSDRKTHCCDVDTTCLGTGLCLSKWDSSFSTGGCTDPTWNTLNCFPHCKTSRLDSVSTIFRCSADNWCCADGVNATSCCDDPQVNLFKIIRGASVQNGTAFIQGYNIAPDEDITGTAVPSSAPSSTSSCAATTVTIVQSSSNASGTGLGVGLGVGLGIGIPFLAAVGILSFLLLREKKRTRTIIARRGSASSMGQIITRPSEHAESPRTDRPSTQADLPPTQTDLAEAGGGKVHELHNKDPPLVAELPDH